MPTSTPDRPRRWALFGLNLVQALIFSAAASLLPWRDYPVFAALTGLLSVGYLLTALAAARPDARLPRLWRLVSCAALSWLFLLTWSVATSAVYLARIYGSLGAGIAIALVIGWCIPVLVTVPTACWALGSTAALFPGGSRAGRGRTQGAVIAAILVLAATWHKLAAASTTPVVGVSATPGELANELSRHLPDYRELKKRKGAAPPFTLGHTECKNAPTPARVTIFVQLTVAGHERPTVETHCVQRDTPSAAFQEVGRIVRERALRKPIKIDVVSGLQPLDSTDPLLDGFKLRPGLDGICEQGDCLMGWQLVGREMVNANTPVSAIPELRMGFEPRQMRRALGNQHPVSDLGGLTRIETQSFVYDGELLHLSRMHRAEVTLSEKALRRADQAVQKHIGRQLLEDGRFRYRVHPFSGKVDEKEFNLARQAGTTLAVCELARKKSARSLAERSLAMIASLEKRSGDHSLLVSPPDSRTTDLGDQALPLSALLTCRTLLGKQHDTLIGRLGTSLLAMQREAGDFHPEWDVTGVRPIVGPPPLFAPGQAVLALVLMEKALFETPNLPFPPRKQVSEAIDKAMHYYGVEYWDHPLGKLFYIEENWHCLAARAALARHRNDAYERFCIAHSDFKSRFIVGDESPTLDMVGAFALAALIPPPNTATAGVGETLAASIALKRARHEDTTLDEQRMQRIMTFLLRQQWAPETCGACRRPELVLGGFSDSMLTPSLRIDFAQHAWAALRHGGHVLGLGPAARQP